MRDPTVSRSARRRETKRQMIARVRQQQDDVLYGKVERELELQRPYHFLEENAVITACTLVSSRGFSHTPHELERLWYSREPDTDIAL